jgi:hypothetical protein
MEARNSDRLRETTLMIEKMPDKLEKPIAKHQAYHPQWQGH